MRAGPVCSCVRALLVAAAAFVPSAAVAQTAPLGGRVEIAGGVNWSGGSALGSRDAVLTAPAGGGYRLFSTTTKLDAAPGIDARVGVSLSRTLQVEFGASYARPELRSSLSNDAEQSAPVVAGERVQQFIFDGSLVVHLRRWTFARRVVPFAVAGAGYLRDLHDGQTLAVTGQSVHVGGGVKYEWLTRDAKRLKSMGARADVRALARRKGTSVDERVHVTPAGSVELFARF